MMRATLHGISRAMRGSVRSQVARPVRRGDECRVIDSIAHCHQSDEMEAIKRRLAQGREYGTERSNKRITRASEPDGRSPEPTADNGGNLIVDLLWIMTICKVFAKDKYSYSQLMRN